VQITIRLFARQRELAGWRLRTFDLPESATVAQAWQRLVAEIPVLEPGGASVRFARNTAYVDPDQRLADGDELAIIPPVAGGAGLRTLELRAEPFDDAVLAELRASVPTSADGALVLFVGQTRESPGSPAPGDEAEAARFAGSSVEGLE
jgi:molybdopterin converting factor subunit 1